MNPATLLLAAALAAAPVARGDEPAQAASSDRLLTARVEALVRPAHEWLVEHQNPDGSFSVPRHDAAVSAPVAVTSLSALSLMAAGNLPGRGRHEAAVRRAVDWLVERCDARGYFSTDNDGTSKMHGQGYAVLALAQAWGMEAGDRRRRDELRAAIERGVRLIEECQSETGGWWYDPVRGANHEGSITVCMIQALRAARDVGFRVERRVIDRAQDYMRRSQDARTGRFRYQLGDSKTSWALTAAALSTLNALGEYASAELDLGFDALRATDPFTSAEGWDEPFVDYGALYAAQAYWQYRDPRGFEQWWPAFVAACEERQREDGRFEEGRYGSVFGTAIVTLALQVPLGYLPLFQR